MTRRVRVWDVASGQPVHTLKRHTEVIFGVACSTDGCFALSGSGDKTLKLWDLSTARRLSSLEKHNVVLCVDCEPRRAVRHFRGTTTHGEDLGHTTGGAFTDA